MVCAACGCALNGGSKFCSGCGRVVDERAYAQEQRRLTRPLGTRKIAGVCAGVALYCGWDVTTVRLVAVLATIFGVGMPVLAYFVGWIVMPDSPYVVPVQPNTQAGPRPGATTS
jgi:phage shock protein C